MGSSSAIVPLRSMLVSAFHQHQSQLDEEFRHAGSLDAYVLRTKCALFRSYAFGYLAPGIGPHCWTQYVVDKQGQDDHEKANRDLGALGGLDVR